MAVSTGDFITATMWNSLLTLQAWVLATPLLNSWVTPGALGATYQVAGFTKTPDGEVLARGVIGAGVVNTTIFTFPTGYRPLLTEVFSCAANGGSATVSVDSAGVVKVLAYTGGGTNVFVSLAGIRFSTI